MKMVKDDVIPLANRFAFVSSSTGLGETCEACPTDRSLPNNAGSVSESVFNGLETTVGTRATAVRSGSINVKSFMIYREWVG